MEVIILSSNNSDWSDNLFNFVSLDFDTQAIKQSQFEDNIDIIDKPSVIICNLDAYLEFWNIIGSIAPLFVFVIIDNVYFDAYDTRFVGKSKVNFPLRVYGNINNVMNSDIFEFATVNNINYDSEDFLNDVRNELKDIAKSLSAVPQEPIPKLKEGVRVSRRQHMPKVTIRGIFSNGNLNLSYLQKTSSK